MEVRQLLKNAEEIAYMKGKMEGIDKKVDDLCQRQDEIDTKLDTLIEQMSVARTMIFAGKAFLAGCLALLGSNLDNIIEAIRHLVNLAK